MNGSDANRLIVMSPKEWIAYLRRKVGADVKFDVPPDLIEDLMRRLPETERETARSVWQGRRGQSFSEIQDELMQLYLRPLLPVLNYREKEIADSTFFGILPTRDFNGYAGFTPRGDRVIVLHQGLGYTINFWSNWQLRVIEESGRDYLLQDPDRLLDALTHMLNAWYGNRYPAGLPDIYPRTKDSWDLSQCLTDSAIAFVLGHELGHVVYDHKGYGPSRQSNHAMEYQADRCGLSIALRHSIVRNSVLGRDNYYPKFMLFGPLFATAVISLLGDSDSPTHPSASERREHLIAAYEEELSLILGDKVGGFVDAIDEDLLDILAKNARGLFEVFGNYRSLMDEIDVGPRYVDNTWLEAELRGS